MMHTWQMLCRRSLVVMHCQGYYSSTSRRYNYYTGSYDTITHGLSSSSGLYNRYNRIVEGSLKCRSYGSHDSKSSHGNEELHSETTLIQQQQRVNDNDNPTNKTKKKKKRRLDDVCGELYPEYSRNVIQSFISQGKVLVDDRPVLKSGTQIDPLKMGSIRLTAHVPRYVCRAGVKMEGALEAFFGTGSLTEEEKKSLFRGRVALDAGLSTGGFTDCLLQHGVDHVYGVDVGYGQVAEKVRVDGRVTVMERTNLRHLRRNDLLEISNTVVRKEVDLVSLDLSFISTLKMREAVCDIMDPHGDLIMLIKPQFEAGKDHVGAGGVVRDQMVRQNVVDVVVKGWEDVGFECQGVVESPIKGATGGNVEYLCHMTRR
jgi:23S rRNA (cytidine1920-2'-O)/16S rRNA (cytidine1409-2'-O)-methyltransferase